MMHEKAMSIHAALGKMLPRVSAEDAETLRICRRNIAELAEQATELENRLTALEQLRQRGDAWADALAVTQPFRVAVNHSVVHGPHELADGDEVAIFPPVTGG